MINHVSDMFQYHGKTIDHFGADCTGQIQYRFNQQGFRSDIDFDHVPFGALFGCSSVFGIGVDNRQVVASMLPDTYNFGLAGNYTNRDIYLTVENFLNSCLYSPATQMCVVWNDRDQECLPEYINNLKDVRLYHFFCGHLISGHKHFKFVKDIDRDVSNTHMGAKTHSFFSKILWALFDQS